MNEEKKNLLTAERMAILQGFVDYYLLRTKNSSFAKEYPDIKDEYGKLNNKQTELLHYYLMSVYKNMGLDLEKVLADKGETYNGTLTNFEKDELVRLADDQIGLVAIMMNRKERLFNK